MSATVDIQTEINYDVLSIPIQAVTTRTDTLGAINEESDEVDIGKPEEAQEVVFVISGDETRSLKKEVKTGIQDNNYIEILSGLEEDDKVVVAPYSAISKKLGDSTLVEVVTKKELFKPKKK